MVLTENQLNQLDPTGWTQPSLQEYEYLSSSLHRSAMGEVQSHRIIIIIIIIIIKRGWQCKSGRERLTPYQSEDPNPTTPTHRKKEEKGKTEGDKK